MDLKRLLHLLFYLQITFVVSGIYLLIVYIITNNTEQIQMMTFVLCMNLLAIKHTKNKIN